MQSKYTERNSNLEILRIVAMMLIVMHHYAVHSFDNETLQTINWDWHLVNWFSEGGKLGVAIFVMISGYYMVESKYTLRKFLKLWGEVIFYNLLIFTLFNTVLVPVEAIEFDFQTVFHQFFPLIYYQYWFVSAYVLLMICSPFINHVLHSFSKERLKVFIVLLMFTQTFLPVVSSAVNQLSLFGDCILFYFIAGYIRLYYSDNKPKRHLILAIVFYVLLIICTTYNAQYREINSIVIIIVATELLLYFSLLKPKNSRLIQTLSSATFGIYLIHDNEYMRYYLWKTVFNNQNYYGSNHLWKYAVVSVLLVYGTCTIIDLLRQISIEKLWMKIGDTYLIPAGRNTVNFWIAIDHWIIGIKNRSFTKKHMNFIKMQFALALIVSAILSGFGFYRLLIVIIPN